MTLRSRDFESRHPLGRNPEAGATKRTHPHRPAPTGTGFHTIYRTVRLDAVRRPFAWGAMGLAWASLGYGIAVDRPAWSVVAFAWVLLGLALMPPVKPTVEGEW